PRFIDGCRSSSYRSIGIVNSQWQWLNSSLLNPVFSEPNNSATRLPSRLSSLPIIPAAAGKTYNGCCSTRSPTAVVPTTSVQSATESATLSNATAPANTSDASTADRADSNGT